MQQAAAGTGALCRLPLLRAGSVFHTVMTRRVLCFDTCSQSGCSDTEQRTQTVNEPSAALRSPLSCDRMQGREKRVNGAGTDPPRRQDDRGGGPLDRAVFTGPAGPDEAQAPALLQTASVHSLSSEKLRTVAKNLLSHSDLEKVIHAFIFSRLHNYWTSFRHHF